MPDAFRAAWWLRGPHAQTIGAKLAPREPAPPARRERWELPDGDFLDLVRLDGTADRPRLLLLHGLEGSAHSHYAKTLLVEAARRGWPADLLLFRSCGDEPNRLLRSYHSGETGDLDHVVRRLIEAEPDRDMLLAGVSLGGNVLLKWLGEQGGAAPRQVRAAAALSTPYDLALGARNLELGVSRIYGEYFLRSLRRKAEEKHRRFPGAIDWERVRAARTIRAFDDAVTAPVHGFRDAGDYYARSSSLGFLAAIRVPTFLLSATDDPFLPPAVLDRVRAIASANPSLSFEFTARGGHVGFVEGPLPWRARFYAERRLVDALAAAAAAAAR